MNNVGINLKGESTGREYRSKIIDYVKAKKYLQAHNLCIDFQRAIDSNKSKYNTKDKFYCHLYLSTTNKRLGNFEEAIKHAELCLKYSNSTKDYIDSYTLIALAHKMKGETDRVIEIYDYCMEICDDELSKLEDIDIEIDAKKGILEAKATILNNKGGLLYQELYIYQSIKIYKQLNYKDELRQKIISSKINKGYGNIFDILFERKDYDQAYNVTKNIDDITFREQLRNRVVGYLEVASTL